MSGIRKPQSEPKMWIFSNISIKMQKGPIFDCLNLQKRSEPQFLRSSVELSNGLKEPNFESDN